MSGLLADATGAESLGPGIVLWRGAVDEARYLTGIAAIGAQAPFRHMRTPGGRDMSVAMTNCGRLGWVSDASGYRYAAHDPDTGRPWPALPEAWATAATAAAARAGYPHFAADACLINRYAVGARMSAHQDRNEADFAQPVVSVSLGLPATFVFHGLTRGGPARTIALNGGDVLVWGGAARLHFHAVRPVRPGLHPLCGAFRYNLTLRRAGA